MERVCRKMLMSLPLFCATVMPVSASADEPVTLLGTIVITWKQYLRHEVGG